MLDRGARKVESLVLIFWRKSFWVRLLWCHFVLERGVVEEGVEGGFARRESEGERRVRLVLDVCMSTPFWMRSCERILGRARRLVVWGG